MQDFFVILQPNTYNQEKQPQLCKSLELQPRRHILSKLAAGSRIRQRIREPAANLLSICLLSCSSRDLQKLRLLFLLICIRLQRYLFSFTFRHIFAKYLMDSLLFSLFEDSTLT